MTDLDLKELSTKNLSNKEIKELERILAQAREKLRELRFSVNANQLKNVKSIKPIKKIIARILTIINIKKQ